MCADSITNTIKDQDDRTNNTETCHHNTPTWGWLRENSSYKIHWIYWCMGLVSPIPIIFWNVPNLWKKKKNFKWHLCPVTCDPWPVTCDLWILTSDLWPVICHLSPVTCHLSPGTWHLAPVTCHLSPVTLVLLYASAERFSVSCMRDYFVDKLDLKLKFWETMEENVQ